MRCISSDSAGAISRSAFATRASTYAKPARKRAVSGVRRSSRAAISRTLCVSPAGALSCPPMPRKRSSDTGPLQLQAIQLARVVAEHLLDLRLRDAPEHALDHG